jgi:hypothetical protein
MIKHERSINTLRRTVSNAEIARRLGIDEAEVATIVKKQEAADARRETSERRRELRSRDARKNKLF